MLVNLPKKISLEARAILAQYGSKLCLMIHSLNIFLEFCGRIKHNRQTKVTPVNFPKNLLLGQYGSNLDHNYTTLYHINCSRNLQKHSIIMWCISQILVILVKFSKKSVFGRGAIRANIMQPQSHNMLCEDFLK